MLTPIRLWISSLRQIFVLGEQVVADLQEIKTKVTDIKVSQTQAFARADAFQKKTTDALAAANAKIDELIAGGADPAILNEIKVDLVAIDDANKAFLPV